MAGTPVLAPYFDLSLQHAAGSLLRAMRRPGDGERHLDLIARIRRAAPQAALRSSFIVGFPRGTESDGGTPERGPPPPRPPGGAGAVEPAGRTGRPREVQERTPPRRNAAAIGSEFEV